MQLFNNLVQAWQSLTTPKKTLLITGSLALFYCTTKIYSKRKEIIPRILMNMPEHIRYTMFKNTVGSGMVINANIYPYALWMIYKIDRKNIHKVEELLPSDLTIMKHKILASDKYEDYYLCYNIYMSSFNNLESIRIEINVIAKHIVSALDLGTYPNTPRSSYTTTPLTSLTPIPAKKENRGCWVVIDYYTDGMRFDPITPFCYPNCIKKYFDINGNINSNKKEIKAGIYIKNQEKKFDLFDFEITVNLNDKPLIVDNSWITANDEMYMGGNDKKKLDQSGYVCMAEFDQKEHENYLNADVIKGVNNICTDIRGEFVMCFAIPNQQNYKITI